jgi:hypothetical protein
MQGQPFTHGQHGSRPRLHLASESEPRDQSASSQSGPPPPQSRSPLLPLGPPGWLSESLRPGPLPASCPSPTVTRTCAVATHAARSRPARGTAEAEHRPRRGAESASPGRQDGSESCRQDARPHPLPRVVCQGQHASTRHTAEGSVWTRD